MKLIIQIPCWNEEQTLPATYAELPTEIPGFDAVETLVIDDGSTDRTVEVARALGVTHVLQLVTHQGLARAFERGVLECLRLGADVVVNTDADNQYCAADMPKLVQPILRGEADYVIGDRSVEALPHFSWIKKKLQRFGSYVVRVASRTHVPDTTSGYRALTRRAILQLSVHSSYTYTHETLIQAGLKNIPVASVKVRVNPVLRPSRLFKSIPRYVLRSANTIVRIYLIYNAFSVFVSAGLTTLLMGLLCFAAHLAVPFAWPGVDPGATLLWLGGGGVFLGCQLLLVAAVADLLAVNRRLHEEALTYLRAQHFEGSPPPPLSKPAPTIAGEDVHPGVAEDAAVQTSPSAPLP